MARPATVTIRGDASQLHQTLARMREDGNKTAGVLQRDFESTFRRLAGVVATGAFAGFIRQNAQVVDQLAKTADRLGVTTQSLQALRLAARGAGADITILDKALFESQKRLADAAATGKGDAADWLKRLNLNTRELQRLSPDQLFARYSEAIAGLNNRGDQFNAIQALMGKGTEKLINLIDGGSPALKQAAEDIKQLGIAITRVDAKQIEIANDAIERAQAVSEGLGQRLAVAFAPFVAAYASGLVETAKKQGDLNEKITAFARGTFYAFEIAADAVRVFDVAISGTVAIITELERRFLSTFRTIAEVGANLAQRAGLTTVAAGLKASADVIGNIEGFMAAASERAQERVDNALSGIKSFAQIGIEADRIVAEAKKRAEAEVARQKSTAQGGGTPTEQVVVNFDIAKYVEEQIKIATAREEVWTKFDREFITNRLAAEREWADRHVAIRKAAEATVLQLRESAENLGLQILQTVGQRSKAFALAALAFEKALAIQKVLISSKVAATAALEPPPIGLGPVAGAPLAASILAGGYANAALIGALGVAQAVNLFSPGGNAPGSPTNPINTRPGTGSGGGLSDQGTRELGSTVIHFHGFANEENLRDFAELMRTLDNRDIVVFDGRNANAQVIRSGG